MIEMETEQDTSKMLLTVSSFGESLRRFSTGGGVFNNRKQLLKRCRKQGWLLPFNYVTIDEIRQQEPLSRKLSSAVRL